MDPIAEIAGPEVSPFVPETISGSIAASAVNKPDRIAITQYDGEGRRVGSLTFAEVHALSAGLATAFSRLFTRGDRVALWGNNSLGWVVAQLAVARIGAIAVTLDPGLRSIDLEHMLTASGARGVIMDPSYRGQALSEILDSIRPRLPALTSVMLFEDCLRIAREEPPLPAVDVDPDDPAQIVFTSGTTGKPKGVVLHHSGVVGNARESLRLTGLSADCALLNSLPAYSVGGSACINVGALATGRPQIIINHFDASVVIRLAKLEPIGWMPLVPTMLLPLATHPDFHREDFAPLEVVWMGGTVITPEHVRTARETLGVKVVTIYGQTEASGIHAMNSPTASSETISNTVGTPLAHGHIRIADLVTGKTLVRGEIGEIRTRSPYVARRYFGDDAATADMMDGEGYLKTGDLGLIDADGNLRITGRLKEVIIRGGRNIYPREIEDLLCAFPGIAEAAVVGIAHPRWGEEVAAAVRAAPGVVLDFTAARAFLEERVSAYKIPKLWRQVDDFPRGGQGKIRKVDLAPLFASDKG